MKTKFIISIVVVILGLTPMYASFPVTRTVSNVENNTTVSVDNNDDTMLVSPAATAADDDYLIAVLLWLLLGGFAAHRWYLGSPVGWNILFILTLGGLGIWWIIDGIDIITKKYPGL